MSYGNWCGPNWSAGQKKPAYKLTKKDKQVPAINKLDFACKNHDINIQEAKTSDDIKKANNQFYKEASSAGLLGKSMAAAVAIGGPNKPHSSKNQMLRKRNLDFDSPTNKMQKLNVVSPDDGGNDPPAMMMAMASEGGGGTKGQTKETPIIYANPTYCLSDTHTTILPLIYNFSMVGVRLTDALRVTMNATDIINPVTFTTAMQTPVAGASLVRGFFDTPCIDGPLWPATISGLVPNGKVPTVSGHAYWKQIYEYYTVTNCEWDMTIVTMSSATSRYNGLTIGEYEESYNTSTGNGRYPTGPMVRAKHMEQIKWKNISGYNSNADMENVTTLSGNYWPGKVKTNVRDDAEVKIWNLINSSPQLTEGPSLLFYRPPAYSGSYPDDSYRFNIVLEMKYTVQYKDRVSAYKFPGASVTSIATDSSLFFPYN